MTIFYPITHTTRPPRPGEMNGVDYHFCSVGEFEALRDSDLLECTTVGQHHYGTTTTALKKALAHGTALLVMDPNGLEHAHRVAIAAGHAVISVFISTPQAICAARLGERPDGANRLAVVEKEQAWAFAYQYHLWWPLSTTQDSDRLLALLLHMSIPDQALSGPAARRA